MTFTASLDEDVNRLFDRIIEELEERLNYSPEDALSLATDYYKKFTNESFCSSLGIPVQNADDFFHEGPPGMALRIHYQLTLKGNPESMEFLEWRKNK